MTASDYCKKSRAQSAMEYLTTYGWSILIIAVVIGALFELRVFSPTLPASCASAEPYLCTNPTLTINGILAARIGELGSAITVTNLNCSGTSAVPSAWTTPAPVPLVSGAVTILNFSCPVPLGTVGASFSGKLWIRYSTATQSGLVAQVGTVTATATGAGPQPIATAGQVQDYLTTAVAGGVGGTVTPASGTHPGRKYRDRHRDARYLLRFRGLVLQRERAMPFRDGAELVQFPDN